MDSKTKKTLVAYFSHSGNTRVIAGYIHTGTGGDIFEIVPVKPYPAEYDAVVRQADRELRNGYRPELAAEIGNSTSYDTVFLGYPNWWGTMPMAVCTFLEGNDFSDKVIIPFCTHEGSRMGRSVRDIMRRCPHSTVLDGLAVRGSGVKTARDDVNTWLLELE